MFEIQIEDSTFAALADKAIIITGASSGIGLAATRFFSTHGAHVIAADVNPLPEEIKNTTFRRVDLTKWTEQLDLFQWTFDKFGRIDIAFLNAGVAEIEDLFVDTFDEGGRLKEPKHKVLAVNLLAPINGTKIAIHFMKKQKQSGSIVITGSGFNGIGGTPMYAVSKHGLLGMVRTLQTDIPAEFDITLDMVCPFWTDTGIISPEQKEQLASAKKCMQPADAPAKAVAYLALNRESHGRVAVVARG
ncbi:hypothetical protein BDV18DRAFT_156162 [Aspergillus unguis]